MRNSFGKRERATAWCKGKTGLIVFSLCIAFICVFVGISLSNQASPKNNLESFNCRFSSGNMTFSIEVEVDLSDGMDQGEAVNVATCALNRILVVNSEERIGSIESSADLDPNGLWTVKVRCTHSITTWMPGHWGTIGTATSLKSFEAIIDPINRTVEYSLTAIEHH